MQTHKLKCWPEIFEAFMEGIKTFDIRLNDRDYQVGDTIKMREWNPKTKEYTGRGLEFNIAYITTGLFGQLATNTVCMQLEPAMVLGFNIPRKPAPMHTVNGIVQMLKEHKIKKCKAELSYTEEMFNITIDRVSEQTE